MLLIVCVGAAVMALVVPRRSAETGGHVRRSARDLLAQALARYGAPPEGTGVLHRRYAVESERPRTVLTADSWIDAQAPAQHRMQLSIGDQLQEWQAGDGAGRLRYLLIDDQLCSPGYTQEALALRELHVWKMDADAQEEQGAARWRYGVWALGRRYLEVALAADRLRSLGAVAQEENAPSAAVVTLAAEGRAINGTLLLRLDAVSGELREVREVVDDNGVAQSRTPWRLLDEEWITAADAKRAGIFTTVPRDNRPRELLREMPLLDPACPALVDGAVVSLPQQLASVSFGPSFFGLAQVPAETERIFAASQPLSHGTNPSRAVPGWSAMTYISPGKRLVLYGTLNTNLLADGEERAGDWRIHFTAVGRQVLSGVAARAVDGRNSRLPMETFIFYAEGWMRDELLSALGTVRVLKLGDTLDDDPRMFDPVPMPGTVRAIMRSALPVTERPAGQLLHGIYDYQMRKEAVVGTLPDPYHAKPVDGITEFWVAYDVDGLRARYRTIQLFNPKQIRSVEWSVNGERRVYYPGLGVVDNVPAVTGDPMWRLEESVRDVFRFGLFDIAEGPPGTITLRGAVPVAATGLLNVQHSQHQSRSAALYWPWMADLTFDFVTYRRTFDRRSGQLVSAETWADVGGRLTLLERLDVERLETLSDVTGADLNYTPPVGTPVLDVTFSAISSRRTRSSPRLDDVVALSSTPLWGWRDPAIASFASATLSGQEGEPGYWFEQIDNIVETKAAVRLHYLLVSGKEVSLLEGRAPYIRLSLLQTPPEWTESLEHRLRLGGADGTVWLMRDDGERRWAILEIDGLVIVAGYSASVDNAEILALLAKLEPLP
jgi:hypothetical protein